MDQRDQALKMEDPIRSSSFFDSFFSSNPSTSFLDYATEGAHDDKGSVGFMELLGVHDFGFPTSSVLQEPVPVGVPSLQAPQVQSLMTSLPPPKAETPNYTSTAAPESPELLNAPPTPNSSSISSESTSAPLNDDFSKPTTDEEEQHHKTNKHLKPKKTSQKKQKEPRFAFMTKSEVDHLEDGYRWRKYGQKAVKNSPFPRSYYRCTSASCNVKKRVERSFNDPSIVVTTYEGQHTHPSPMIHRQGRQAQSLASGFFTNPTIALPTQMTLSQQLQFNNMTPLNCGFTSNRYLTGALERRFSTPPPTALLRDDGLLQDIVPSTMRKEE